MNSLKSLIDESKEVLILLPANPNFDVVAAGLGLYLTILSQKNAFISCPTAMTVEFNRLVGVNKVKGELGGKNLTLRLVDYSAKNIEKVSYDIVDDEFRLMVVPKDGINPPGQDMLHVTYSGVSADTVILIGGESEEDFPVLSSNELDKSKLVHIGTRELATKKGGEIMSFAAPASSVCELVAQLSRENNFSLDADVATNLFAGIQRATGRLSNPDVSADTLEISAQLLRNGARRELPVEAPRARFPFPGVMTGQAEEIQSAPKPENVAPKDWFEPKIFTGNKGTSVS